MWKRGSILLQSARQRSCTYVYLVTETFCSMRSRFLSEHFRDLEVCMVWCTHSVPVCQCAMPYSIAYYGNTIYLRLDPSCTFFRLWYFIAWHTSPKMNERETEMENDKTNFIRWIHSKLIQLIKTIFFCFSPLCNKNSSQWICWLVFCVFHQMFCFGISHLHTFTFIYTCPCASFG